MKSSNGAWGMHHSLPISPPLTDIPEVFRRTFENIFKNTDVGHNCFQCLTFSPTHLRNLTFCQSCPYSASGWPDFNWLKLSTYFWSTKIKAPTSLGFIPQFCWLFNIAYIRKTQVLKSHYRKEHSVHFSHSVVSDSLRPHELQHARPPYPSLTLVNIFNIYFMRSVLNKWLISWSGWDAYYVHHSHEKANLDHAA